MLPPALLHPRPPLHLACCSLRHTRPCEAVSQRARPTCTTRGAAQRRAHCTCGSRRDACLAARRSTFAEPAQGGARTAAAASDDAAQGRNQRWPPMVAPGIDHSTWSPHLPLSLTLTPPANIDHGEKFSALSATCPHTPRILTAERAKRPPVAAWNARGLLRQVRRAACRRLCLGMQRRKQRHKRQSRRQKATVKAKRPSHSQTSASPTVAHSLVCTMHATEPAPRRLGLAALLRHPTMTHDPRADRKNDTSRLLIGLLRSIACDFCDDVCELHVFACGFLHRELLVLKFS